MGSRLCRAAAWTTIAAGWIGLFIFALSVGP